MYRLAILMIEYDTKTITRWVRHWQEVYKVADSWVRSLPARLQAGYENWKRETAQKFDEIKEIIKFKLSEWGLAVTLWLLSMPEKIKIQLELWKQAIIDWFTSLPEVFNNGFNGVWASIRAWYEAKKETFFIWWDNLGQMIPKALVQGYKKQEPTMAGKIVEYILLFIGLVLVTLVVGFIDVGIRATQALQQKLQEGLQTIFKWFIGFVKGGIAQVGKIFISINTWVETALSNVYNTLVGWLTKALDRAKQIAKDIRKAISEAFNVKKRNSPSILDRLEDIVNTSNSMLRKVVIPNYSSQISKALGQVNSTIDLTGRLNENTRGGNTIVNNINATLNDGLDIDTLADRLAFNFRNTNL